MSEILAKSKKTQLDSSAITLKRHIEGLLESLDNLSNVIKNKDIDFKLIKLAIFVHDIGKASPSFQISVGNYNYSPKVPFPDVPHSLFSLVWINKNELIKYVSNEDDVKILLSAVAFHHWRDNFHNILLGVDDDFKRAVKIILENEEFRNKLLENIRFEFSNSSNLQNFCNILGFDEEIATTIQNGNNLLLFVIPPYYNYFLPQRTSLDERFKKKWIYTSGLLMRTDHFTSFIQEEGIDEKIEKICPEYSSIELEFKQKLKEKTGKAFKDDEIWQIMDLQNKRDKNLILVAPTGSGKTEFAYLWGAGNKIFFTLPLRSAVNAIFERACSIFGMENVGLLHSDADVYLYEKSSNYDGESFRALDLARQLSFPVLVSTGDQIFPAALKYPGYEKIYATLGYSRLVIDEVQAYDPRAVAIIVKLIEDVVKLGGKFLLMTATLPSFVKEQIEVRIGKENFEVIDKYTDCDNISKHKVELCEGDILSKIDEIMRNANADKRILVIANTVELAQRIYQDIKERVNNEDIYIKLLHSKFTLDDRKKFEDKIVGNNKESGKFGNPKPDNEKEAKIVVATQVVEASLDIDADILYTELAPIDALIQRMGRVLRRIRDKESYEKYLKNSEKSGDPNIFIFYHIPSDSQKLCSGAGSVYQNDLLAFSLALLCEKAGIITRIKIEGLKKKYWSDETKEKGKNKSGNSVEDFIKELFGIDSDDQNKPKVQKQRKKRMDASQNEPKKITSFSIAENEKKTLVENLYDLLPSNSTYLQKFYETLSILDAGYMSDRKKDALKMFREIYTVPAIPEKLKDNKEEDCIEDNIEKFKQAINNFIKLNGNSNKFNFTYFKIEVLSKFVVNIDIRKYLYGDSLSLRDASYIAYETEYQSNEQLDKIKKWLKGVYVFSGIYDKERGLIKE